MSKAENRIGNINGKYDRIVESVTTLTRGHNHVDSSDLLSKLSTHKDFAHHLKDINKLSEEEILAVSELLSSVNGILKKELGRKAPNIGDLRKVLTTSPQSLQKSLNTGKEPIQILLSLFIDTRAATNYRAL